MFIHGLNNGKHVFHFLVIILMLSGVMGVTYKPVQAGEVGNHLASLPLPGDKTNSINKNSTTFTNCAAQTQIPAAECFALVALYNSTNGANWINNADWLQTDTPCNWYGVVCSNGRNVTWLDLSNNQLNGSISKELGNLTYLTRLSLYNNQLTGSIPTELGSLSQLVGLYLYDNQLSGSIPTELGNLSNLTELVLSYNQLDGSIPTQLGNLTNLMYLGLANNQVISFIPTQLGNLTNLMALYLEGNQLSGSIPTQLGNLTNLRDFRLNNNQLTGSIPKELGNLTQVEFLFLYNNLLSGPIPAELGNLINLSRLWLNNNQLSGPIPTELGNLTSITDLWLNNNQLSGPIPTELGDLTNLSRLWLNNNQLSGSIPTQLGNLTSLTQLFLSSNQLTGPIPTQLGDLTSIESLHLQDNRLSGEFPTSITNLDNLFDLKFDCWITSTDPAVITFIDALQPGWQNRICPTVYSIVCSNPDPTSSFSVDFTVTFSESVTGVDTGDFSLTTTGVSDAVVSNVSGFETVYTVTVNTGIGNGTLRLDVPNSATVTDLDGNPLSGLPFTSGEVYTIDKPSSATFADVATTYWSWSYIERLYAAGITGGCGTAPLIYCPEATVTRAQMAIFLERGMNGSSYTPPAATGTVFSDVPISYWSAAWIEKLSADGITGGCGGGNYCPEASVTRAQMAIFLLRAKHGSSYSPPAAVGIFSDVPKSYWAASWIEQLYAEGITGGCGGGNYCPDQAVSRAQMAIFLVRTFNLP
jgi:Leucine-rich repeat (LRR) protein